MDWGRNYLLVDPEHFRIDYRINPYMDPTQQPDLARARAQWQSLIDAIDAAGGSVEVLDQSPDCPDMVYAMNLAQVWTRAGQRHALLSHMRYPQRRLETPAVAEWLTEHGYQLHWIGTPELADTTQLDTDGSPAPHFESGDAFWWRDELIIGHGPRSQAAAVDRVGAITGVPTVGIAITHPAMFHLDLSFCPLTETAALVCPGAFDPADADALLARVPDPITLGVDEALDFAANCIVVGDTVLGPRLDDRLIKELDSRGLRHVALDLSEFQLSGGSARCLSNPLDITFS